MNEEVRARPTQSTPWMRRFISYAVVLLVVFLLGFLPMWLKARECSGRFLETAQQLGLLRMQNSLASAAIDARRGDYDPAREAASLFFTTLREEIDRGPKSVLTEVQREGVQPLFARRDEIITLLARSDPACADRLSDLYVSYREITNERNR